MEAEDGLRGVRGFLDALQIDLREIGVAGFQLRVSLGEIPQPSEDVIARPVLQLEDFVEATEPDQRREHLIERIARELRVVLSSLHRDRALPSIDAAYSSMCRLCEG